MTTPALRARLARAFFFILAIELLLCARPARADDAISPDAVGLDYGTGNETRITRLNLEWTWNTAWLESNGTHISGYWDASLATWQARAWEEIHGNDRSMADIGFTPVFRLERDDKKGWFLDGGVGPNLLSRLYENRGRDFSTAFQFGDLIAVGYQSERWLAGITLEHFSNGAIKHPNPGANFALCTVGYRFH